MEIGYLIKAARKAAKFTQAELAEKAGIAINSLRLYESGKRQPKIEQLQHIADALCVPITDFLGSSQATQEECLTISALLCKMQGTLRESKVAGNIEVLEGVCLQKILSAIEMYQSESVSFENMVLQINQAISLFSENPFDKLECMETEKELYAQLNSLGREKLISYLRDLVKIQDYTINGP